MANQGRQPLVTYILETLGLHEDDFSDGPPQLLEIYTSTEALVESIHMPILTIMQSILQMAGFVDKVYVNVEGHVCFEVKPDAHYYASQSSFTQMLRVMMRDGTFANPETNEVMLRRLPNAQAMLGQMPPNTVKIGCTSGPATRPMLGDYLATVGNNVPIAIVVGNLTNARVAGYLNATVQVSQFGLTANACLSSTTIALQQKYNLH